MGRRKFHSRVTFRLFKRTRIEGQNSTVIRTAVLQPKIPLVISGSPVGGPASVCALSPSETRPQNTRDRLYVALAEERVESRVSGGENARRTVRHVAVVRELKSAAEFDTHGPSTTEARFQLQPEWGANGLRVVAFIQDPASGYVLGRRGAEGDAVRGEEWSSDLALHNE
jgi:hypothetical protein